MGHSIEFISFLARCSRWPGRQVVSRFRAKTTSAWRYRHLCCCVRTRWSN